MQTLQGLFEAGATPKYIFRIQLDKLDDVSGSKWSTKLLLKIIDSYKAAMTRESLNQAGQWMDLHMVILPVASPTLLRWG